LAQQRVGCLGEDAHDDVRCRARSEPDNKMDRSDIETFNLLCRTTRPLQSLAVCQGNHVPASIRPENNIVLRCRATLFARADEVIE
jgi:hypothetical protein